jgi:hypothetical protein
MIVDALDVSTGWTSSDSSKIAIHAINQIPEYIANNNVGSLIIHLKANSSGAYIEKTITPSVSTSAYEYGSIHYVALRSAVTNFNAYNDQKVKISFNTTMAPLILQNSGKMSPVLFNTANVGTITKIRITSNTNDEDYIIISSLSINKDEMPLDIYKAVKTELEAITTAKYTDGIKVATLTGLAGDKEVVFTGDQYFLSKYAVLKIKSTTHTETHMISENDENLYRFESNYSDGEALKYDYTAADVYLQFPVAYETREYEIRLPGITIQTDTPQEVLRHTKIEKKFDTWDDAGNVSSRIDDQLYEWNMKLDCEARHNELLQKASRICRDFIARNYVWINNKKYYITFNEPSFMQRPVESYNEIPKVEYSFKIENYEMIWARESLPLADAISDTVSIGS